MDCPHCGLINPDTAQRCDCGYDFEKGTIEKSYLTKTDEDSSLEDAPEYTNIMGRICWIFGVMISEILEE